MCTYLYSGPPVNILLNPTTSRSLTFYWDSPANLSQRHGNVVCYTITCDSEEHPGYTFSIYRLGSEREVVLDRLLPYNTYNCCVSIQTTLANSSAVCQKAQTPEEGILALYIYMIYTQAQTCCYAINYIVYGTLHLPQCHMFTYWHTARGHSYMVALQKCIYAT